MQGGNQISETFVGAGGLAILGNNLSAAGNITINAGQSSEKKCLHALFVTDPADDRAKHISFKGEPLRSVFTWIEKVDAYKSWVDRGTGSSLLWISGGPGMGKTMLAIFLSEELKHIAKDNGLVLYYFCEGRDPKRNSPINILRGLIYTLVQQRPALMKHLLPDYEVREGALFESDAIEPLWRILINMVKDPATGVVYCIIDGLDECAPTSLGHLEHMLKKLTSFYRLQTTQKLIFKVALISRDEPPCLPQELSGFERLQLRKSKQAPISAEPPMEGDTGDSESPAPASAITHMDSQESFGYAQSLELYTNEKIDNLTRSKGFDKNYGDLLKQQLARRGDGTFLWVDTAVDQLSDKGSKYSGQDLSSLPGKTDELYCLGLLKAPEGMAAAISFVLSWATVAFRPLMISELSAVVYFVNGQPNGPEIEEVRNAIGWCRSLLDVSQNGEVKLAHQSAKAFLTDLDSPLLQDTRTQQFHVDEAKTHAEIANLSISYVEHAPFHQGWWHLASLDIGTTSDEAVSPDPNLLAQYPFLQYSSIYWPNHLNRSPPGTVNLASPLFSPGSELRRNWFQSVWEVVKHRDGSKTPAYMSLLHIAAFFDLLELAQVLSHREQFRRRIEKPNSELMTPLFTAADRGSPRVFAFLLDYGASKNWSISGEDILQFTSRRGRLELVRILLSRGFNPNLFLSENVGIKAASFALRYAPKKLKNYLVRIGEREDEDISELIKVNHGANMSPLQCAACCGHEEVARVLLDHGANVNYTTTAGWTAMHYAAWAGQKCVIQLIQRYGGNVSVLSNGGWNPLHCAAWRGRTSAGEYLMDQGIHVDLESREGQISLHFAAFQGHHEMVSSLLSRGANTQARTNKGLTPLHLAAAEGHDLVVQILLDYGANRDMTSNHGENALTLALNSQHNTTAQLLQTYQPRAGIHPRPSIILPLASKELPISRTGDHPSYPPRPMPDHTTAHAHWKEASISGPTSPRSIYRKPLNRTSSESSTYHMDQSPQKSQENQHTDSRGLGLVDRPSDRQDIVHGPTFPAILELRPPAPYNEIRPPPLPPRPPRV